MFEKDRIVSELAFTLEGASRGQVVLCCFPIREINMLGLLQGIPFTAREFLQPITALKDIEEEN